MSQTSLPCRQHSNNSTRSSFRCNRLKWPQDGKRGSHLSTTWPRRRRPSWPPAGYECTRAAGPCAARSAAGLQKRVGRWTGMKQMMARQAVPNSLASRALPQVCGSGGQVTCGLELSTRAVHAMHGRARQQPAAPGWLASQQQHAGVHTPAGRRLQAAKQPPTFDELLGEGGRHDLQRLGIQCCTGGLQARHREQHAGPEQHNRQSGKHRRQSGKRDWQSRKHRVSGGSLEQRQQPALQLRCCGVAYPRSNGSTQASTQFV